VLKALDSVPLHQADQAVAMTSSFTFLGQFLSPVVLDGIGKIANTDNIRFQYGTLSVVIMVVVFISTFVIIRSTKRLPSANLYISSTFLFLIYTSVILNRIHMIKISHVFITSIGSSLGFFSFRSSSGR